MTRRVKSRAFALAASAAWLAAIVAGSAVVHRYDNAAGRPALAPVDWPAGTALSLNPDGFTLVMLAHPKCACSRASLEDLDRLLRRCPSSLRAIVLMVRPEGTAAGWERGALWEQASAIPRVTVRTDEQGWEIALFGAGTSGQVLLYDRGGRLRFRGGVTPSRGQAGESAGAEAVVKIARGESAGGTPSPVFGCSLWSPGKDPGQGSRP